MSEGGCLLAGFLVDNTQHNWCYGVQSSCSLSMDCDSIWGEEESVLLGNENPRWKCRASLGLHSSLTVPLFPASDAPGTWIYDLFGNLPLGVLRTRTGLSPELPKEAAASFRVKKKSGGNVHSLSLSTGA